MTIRRNMSTPENREFWASAERTAREVESWPAWKRAGINVPDGTRERPRPSVDISRMDLVRALQEWNKTSPKKIPDVVIQKIWNGELP